ncbi:uncharacterized protein LOC109714238 isoform X3 [Ananas comosus]|uniref:Uncharacterized protein LOC109714238 isoform X3 n=1 Tax=Ananas comosus TaxID=4615 RepID=A0A6P5FEK3_ANACO|nr:uncharacterized protein LOC109714238 isoform X3 [Ananas comosus]
MRMMMMMMMVRGGDLNLNCSPQSFEDSIWEGLKQAMLQHELIFRDQVRELHRLYWTQKNLMHELLWKGSDLQTHSLMTQSKEDDFRELTSNSCELQKRPARDFDLELPADGFVSDESFEVKSSVCDETGFNTREAGDHHSGINLNARGTVEEDPSLVRSNEAEIGGVWSESNADLREPREKGKEQTLSAGSNACSDSPPSQSDEKQKLQIDLNISLDDDAMYILPDHSQMFPSPSTSSSVVHHGNLHKDPSEICREYCESDNRFSKEFCTAVQPNLVFPALEISGEMAANGPIRHPHDSHMPVDSESGRQLSTVTFSNNSKDDKLHTSVGSSDLPPSVDGDLGEKRTHNDGSEEDTVSSHAVAESEKLYDKVAIDHVVTRAAETLLSFSFVNPTCLMDCLDRNIDVAIAETSYLPQYSSDSFERIILNLEEIADDGLSAPAITNNKENVCGIKLRRGRGLRDFQKDILPGLVSLSRHEICEDLHTIGYELRKNRSKRTCRERRPYPTIGRHLRNHSGRRRP